MKISWHQINNSSHPRERVLLDRWYMRITWTSKQDYDVLAGSRRRQSHGEDDGGWQVNGLSACPTLLPNHPTTYQIPKAPRNNHLQLFFKIGTKQTKPISTTLTNSSFYKLFFFLGPWTKFTHAVELLCTLWGKQKEKEKRWATHLTMVIKLLRYQPGAKDPIPPTAPNITLYKVIWFYTTLHPWWISGSIIDFIAVIAFSYPQQFVSFPFQHINRGITLKKFLLPWTKMKEMTNHVHRWANWARANSKRYKGNC